jgi:hypothetical protein
VSRRTVHLPYAIWRSSSVHAGLGEVGRQSAKHSELVSLPNIHETPNAAKFFVCV